MFVLNTWYIAAWSEDVADKPFPRRICNEAIVFFRDKHSGKIAALADMCCHRGAPLSLGTVVEEGLECGYHGVVHDCSGKCVLRNGPICWCCRPSGYPPLRYIEH